jgi:hypothetical protein
VERKTQNFQSMLLLVESCGSEGPFDNYSVQGQVRRNSSNKISFENLEY